MEQAEAAGSTCPPRWASAPCAVWWAHFISLLSCSIPWLPLHVGRSCGEASIRSSTRFAPASASSGPASRSPRRRTPSWSPCWRSIADGARGARGPERGGSAALQCPGPERFWLLIAFYRRESYAHLREMIFLGALFTLVVLLTAGLSSFFPGRPELVPIAFVAILMTCCTTAG